MDSPREHHVDVTRRAVLGGAGIAAVAALGGRSDVAAQGATPQGVQPSGPQLEWIGTLSAQLGQPSIIGETPHGTRMIVPVVGGTFAGPNLTATFVPPSADWVLVRPDGVGELDVRSTLQTEDGAMLYVTYRGYLTNVPEWLPRWAEGEEISSEEYYFVATVYVETGAPEYDWLQRTVIVAIGSLALGGVTYEFYAVG